MVTGGIRLEPCVALEMHLDGVPHRLNDLCNSKSSGVRLLGTAMAKRLWRQLFALVLGFIPQRHPVWTTAQVLVQRIAPITVTVQRRQCFTNLQPCLQLPINGGAIDITRQQGCNRHGSVLAPLVPPIDFWSTDHSSALIAPSLIRR